MSGLFDRLAARATGTESVAVPRLTGLFEPIDVMTVGDLTEVTTDARPSFSYTPTSATESTLPVEAPSPDLLGDSRRRLSSRAHPETAAGPASHRVDHTETHTIKRTIVHAAPLEATSSDQDTAVTGVRAAADQNPSVRIDQPVTLVGPDVDLDREPRDPPDAGRAERTQPAPPPTGGWPVDPDEPADLMRPRAVSTNPEPTPTPISVTIGRIDVGAAPRPVVVPRPRTRQSAARIPLDSYLRGRR